MDRPIRPVDIEYANDPDKREADFEAMRKDLRGVDPALREAEEALASGDRAAAVRGFVEVAARATGGLHLYEALGLNFENPRLGYPHYLLYKLEAHLQGQTRTERPDGTVSIAPAHPELGQILELLGRTQEELAAMALDPAVLHESATLIAAYIGEYILTEPQLLG